MSDGTMTRAERLVALTGLRRQLRDTEAAIAALLRDEYPIGTDIRFGVGLDRFFDGRVMSHSHSDRIRVRNIKTGTARWIYAGDLQRGETNHHGHDQKA